MFLKRLSVEPLKPTAETETLSTRNTCVHYFENDKYFNVKNHACPWYLLQSVSEYIHIHTKYYADDDNNAKQRILSLVIHGVFICDACIEDREEH